MVEQQFSELETPPIREEVDRLRQVIERQEAEIKCLRELIAATSLPGWDAGLQACMGFA